MHSLTYPQKSCRQNAGSRDAYVYIRTFFATRKLQRAGQRAESKKNAYTIYTLNVHFLYSKSGNEKLKTSGGRDSTPRRQPWEGCILPLNYLRLHRVV